MNNTKEMTLFDLLVWMKDQGDGAQLTVVHEYRKTVMALEVRPGGDKTPIRAKLEISDGENYLSDYKAMTFRLEQMVKRIDQEIKDQDEGLVKCAECGGAGNLPDPLGEPEDRLACPICCGKGKVKDV